MITALKRPLRVAYDIARLFAGGANGGIKVHHYEFLRNFVERFSDELQLHVFCQEEIVPELSFLSSHGLHQIHILGPRSAFEPRSSDGSLPVLHYWPEPPEDLLALLEIDVLYAGFGFSRLFAASVPQVSLIVDALHRSFPDTLPPAEVSFRDDWYAREIERSTSIQTNSQFCKDQLVEGFGADPDKVFTLSLPLHVRFNRIQMGALPAKIAHLPHRYFLYPANYWLHKNHRNLVEAFALYRKKEGDQALHLVLTGQEDERSYELRKQIEALGLADTVHLLGHLDLPSYKAVWELAHSLVFPSRYEGFGLPLIEALYFQKPVACSNEAFANEFLAPAALKVDTRQPTELAEALSRLQANPSDYLDDAATLQRFDSLDEVQTLFDYWKAAASRNRKAETTDA